MKKKIIEILISVILAYIMLVLLNAGAIYVRKGDFDVVMSVQQISLIPFLVLPVVFICYTMYKAKKAAKAHPEESTKE